MSRFIKPNIDKTIYLFSDKANIVSSGSQNIEYRWDIPEISLNEWGKLFMVAREYKTLTPATTPITTRIANIATKDCVDTRRGGGTILDVSCWNYTAPFNAKPPLILPPQVINSITLTFDDDLQEVGVGGVSLEPVEHGIPNTSSFVIVLKITEDNIPITEWGSTNAVNVRQMQIPTYNNWN